VYLNELVKLNVEGLSIKAGPTESGFVDPKVVPDAVGGELLSFSVLEALPAHLILFLLLMIPAFLLLYKKKDYAINLIARLFF
jgi:hypothetical protein